MRLTDFVVSGAITPDMNVGTKDEAIRKMVGSLATAGSVRDEDQESIIKAILKREELGSTGIGEGVAVPHTKHLSVDKLVAAVGLCKAGVDFESLDGNPVCILFLLVSPHERPGDHLRALETVSRHLRNEAFRMALRGSTTVEGVLTTLASADNGQYA